MQPRTTTPDKVGVYRTSDRTSSTNRPFSLFFRKQKKNEKGNNSEAQLFLDHLTSIGMVSFYRTTHRTDACYCDPFNRNNLTITAVR